MHHLIRDLSNTYRNGTQALKDVSLDVPKGMFGLLGWNGARRSTLMRIIATLQEPPKGRTTLRPRRLALRLGGPMSKFSKGETC